MSEGTKTEPEYLRGVARLVRNPRVVCEGRGHDPKSLVEYAILRQRESRRLRHQGRGEEAFDQIWCVFDVDDHAKLNDALQQARDNKLEVCVSNPCVELWAVLHYQDQNAYISTQEVKAMCAAVVPNFRNGLFPVADLEPLYGDAVRRAQALERMHERNSSDGNPSTSIYKLVEAIRNGGPVYRSSPFRR